MRYETKEVGTREEGTLGTFQFPQFETVEEAVASFDESTVLQLINRSYGADLERVAREAAKKTGDARLSDEAIQEIINNYKPGSRTAKPTIKNFQAIVMEFASSGKVEIVVEASKIFKSEGLEAAYNYIIKQK